MKIFVTISHRGACLNLGENIPRGEAANSHHSASLPIHTLEQIMAEFHLNTVRLNLTPVVTGSYPIRTRTIFVFSSVLLLSSSTKCLQCNLNQRMHVGRCDVGIKITRTGKETFYDNPTE
jgi:hypothetical protein